MSFVSNLTKLDAGLGGIGGGTALLLDETFGKPKRKAAEAQKQAQNAALAQAAKQADLADQANNKANSKFPNIAALLAANSGKGGPGTTMLTGSGGVDPSGLLLGRNTLLGG